MGASGAEKCQLALSCPDGRTVQLCTEQDPTGACRTAIYKVSDGSAFGCNGCGDCTGAATSASHACSNGGAPASDGGGVLVEGGFASPGTTRTFTAKSFDNAGNVATATVDIDFYCGRRTTERAAADGAPT